MNIYKIVEDTFRAESRKVISVLLATLCDIELAEDALQDAFVEALRKWSVEGIPQKPGAWIMTTSRRKVIDRLRQRSRRDDKLPSLYAIQAFEEQSIEDMDWDEIPDERLKLIFTCCHPALSQAAQVALTLQTLGGLSTEQVAKAFLVPVPTMAQRLVRAKRKIRDAGIPYQVPPPDKLEERLDTVLSVIYLIFNAGYTVSVGNDLVQADLCNEAIRLARVLHELLCKKTAIGEHPETLGLLALMLLQHARYSARTDTAGQLILLDDQDRSLWHQQMIAEGIAILEQALAQKQSGAYQIQAAIAAVHSEAQQAKETDWEQIVMLYDTLMIFTPSPVVELNRAVAIAMADGVERGLVILDEIAVTGRLDRYYLFHAARANLLRRVERFEEAKVAYEIAHRLCANDTERRFLKAQLDELS